MDDARADRAELLTWTAAHRVTEALGVLARKDLARLDGLILGLIHRCVRFEPVGRLRRVLSGDIVIHLIVIQILDLRVPRRSHGFIKAIVLGQRISHGS